MNEPLNHGELLVKVDYLKLGQAIKIARCGLDRLEKQLEIAGLEAGLVEVEKQEKELDGMGGYDL